MVATTATRRLAAILAADVHVKFAARRCATPVVVLPFANLSQR
jgi:hypothetical protein